jgi:hypothetical protein
VNEKQRKGVWVTMGIVIKQTRVGGRDLQQASLGTIKQKVVGCGLLVGLLIQ